MEEAVALYDRIGVGYDGTRRADPGLTARLAALLDLRRAPGGGAVRHADAGPGGDYAIVITDA